MAIVKYFNDVHEYTSLYIWHNPLPGDGDLL